MTTKTKKPISNGHKPAEQIMQTSLQLLPLIMNNIPQAVFWKDRDLVYLGCNQAFADDTGFSSPEDVIGKTDFDMPWKDQAELYRADDRRILENGEPKLDYEEPQTTPDGSTIWLSTSKIPVNEDGQVVAVLGMYEDITARKQAEKALIESEEKFRAIADNTAIGLFIHQGGIMRYLGREAGRLLGYEVEDVIGRSIMDFIHPDERQRIADMARRRTAGEDVPDHYETRLLRKDGSALDVILYSTLVNYDGKIATQGAFLDITERKQTEQALQDSDAVYSAVVNQAYNGVIIVQDNTCQFANQVLANMLGYTPEEMQGMPFIKFLATESIALVVGRVKARLAGEEVPSIYEIRIQRKDGTAIDAELSAGVIEYHGKSADVAVIRDITERKQADNAIRESEDRFRRFTEATVEGLVFHEQGQIVDANPAAIAMFGFSEAAELIGKNLLEFITPESHELVLKQMQLESVQPYEILGIRKDGSTFPVETSTRIYKSGDRTIRASSIRDITDRKRAEQALQDSEARYSAVVNQASDGVIILQKNTCQFVNQVLADMLGYTPEEMQGTPFINYLAPESRALVAGRVKARLAGEEVPPVYEARLQRKDGTAFDAELSAGVIQYHGESADVGLIRDITERKNLEQQKQTAFERRGRQVQLSTQISQSIAAATSLEELYQRVVTQVKEQFGYYHAQILRYNAPQNAVVLITGYGETGAKMLAAGHRLPMGEGLIGTAAANGETVLRPALENDPDWRPNPLLPETKGEIAVPIKLGNNILGVLDVQSNVADALGADDQLLLEGMCGQIATAIESTRLRQEMSERLDEVNHLYQSMSREGWKTYRDTADLPAGFMFDPTGIKPVDETVLADELFANIPMRVPGGEIVGTLAVAHDPQHPTSLEDRAFFQQVSDQIALALESARLFGQTQSALAQTERLSEAGLRFARSANLQELLAVVNETLGIPEVNRILLGVFNYDSENELESMDIVANWWSRSGHEPSEIGRHYTMETLNVLPLFVSPTAVFFNDTFRDERINESTLETFTRQNIHSMAVLPLYLGAQQIGVLFLESEETYNFTQDEIRLFSALAPQIATVLENRRQFEHAQRQAEREAMLNAISQKIQSATSVEAVLQIAARELGHALGAPRTIAQLSMKDKN